METLSHPCALFIFNFLIIRSILSSFVSKSLIRFCVLQEKLGSVCLFVSKKLLKRLAFVVKSETSKSFTINGGILGVLPLYKKLLSIEQYALGAVRRLSNFSIFWLGDLYKLVRKHCSFFMVIFVTKHGVIRVICSHH